jgi:hypothetical protein
MNGVNPFGLGLPTSLLNGFEDNLDDYYSLEDFQKNDWDLPKHVFEEKGIFSEEENPDFSEIKFNYMNEQNNPKENQEDDEGN